MVTFSERGPGITVASITNSAAKAEISLYGAHVLSFTPKFQKNVLFLSGKSVFIPGKAIRGGIPVCFPWFGPHEKDTTLPVHGFARFSQWKLTGIDEKEGNSTVTLRLSDSEETRKVWPGVFSLELKISVGARLEMTMTVTNTGKKSFVVSDALHTYFSVKNIKTVSVTGLDKVTYIDRVGGKNERTQKGPVQISGETDRVYQSAKPVKIIDPGLKRTILIEKKSFPDSVVWNPWIERAKAIADMGDDEYAKMLCVEAASVFGNSISLESGKSISQKMTITSTVTLAT